MAGPASAEATEVAGSARVWMPCRANDRQIRDLHDLLKEHCGEPTVLIASRNWPTPEQTTIEDAIVKTRWGRIRTLLLVTPTVRIALADAPGATVRISWAAERQEVGRRLLAMTKDWRKWWLLIGYPEVVLMAFFLVLGSLLYSGYKQEARIVEGRRSAAQAHNERLRAEVGEERFKVLLREAEGRTEARARSPAESPAQRFPWWASLLILGGMFAFVAWMYPVTLRIWLLPALPILLVNAFVTRVFPAFWFDTTSTPNAYWGGKIAKTIGALIPVGSLALAVYQFVTSS
jgi:hypothetical protein